VAQFGDQDVKNGTQFKGPDVMGNERFKVKDDEEFKDDGDKKFEEEAAGAQ
jgi:hypothetical protein